MHSIDRSVQNNIGTFPQPNERLTSKSTTLVRSRTIKPHSTFCSRKMNLYEFTKCCVLLRDVKRHWVAVGKQVGWCVGVFRLGWSVSVSNCCGR